MLGNILKLSLVTLNIIFLVINEIPVSKKIHGREYYENRGEVIWEIPVEKKLIALTFDDGPHKELTPQILDLLKQYEAKATFFIVGNRIEQYWDILSRELNEGHEIGNHTYNHVFFKQNVSRQKIRVEIEKTKQKLNELSDTETKWFRPPGGYYNDEVVAVAKELGYTVVLWSWHQDTEDWNRPGVKKIANKVISNARNGDIVLMHDYVLNSKQTLEALKLILPALKEKGFEFVTISSLLKEKYDEETLNAFELNYE